MTRIKLSTPIKVKTEDGREIEQDYLEFSRITVGDAKKYLSGSFLSKKLEYQTVCMEIYADSPSQKFTEDKKLTKTEQAGVDQFFITAGTTISSAFFKIFDDDDIVSMIAALSKLPIDCIEQIDFFDISDLTGEIAPFLLPSQTQAGKK